jgi:GT2 family glycosyltransferase
LLEKIDIIITTKNRIKDLLFTMDHMISLGFSQNQFFITDDGSTDDTFQQIKSTYPDCNIKRNNTSKGLMVNRSDMMLWSKNDFILSIDDDSHIRTTEDIFEAISVLESNKKFGIFHFRVFNQISAPPEKSSLSQEQRVLRGYIGCGHIIKREIIEKLGRYREDLVFYCEELDYSLRAYKLGFSVISQDNIIVHHRIDLLEREKQKSTVNSKGIYGREWRNIHLFANNLIITALYYPVGFDLLFVLYRTVGSFYFMAIKEKQLAGYFKMLGRFIRFVPYIIRYSDKLSYRSFFKWFSYPDMTDGRSVRGENL